MPHRSPVCVNILPRRSAETRAAIEPRRSDELYTPIPAHPAAADPALRGG
jgi:hypothetical protein